MADMWEWLSDRFSDRTGDEVDKKPADDGKKAQPAHPVRHTIVNPSCFTHRKKNAVWK